MPIRYVAVTESALEQILGHPGSSLTAPFVPLAERPGLSFAECEIPGSAVIVSQRDKPACRFALLDCSQLGTFPEGSAREAFARILRTLRASGRFPIRLPVSWAEYHHRDLITFFGLPRGLGNIRWIVRVDESQKAVLFLRVTSANDQVHLETFSSPQPPNLRSCLDSTIARIQPSAEAAQPIAFAEKVDFDAIGAAAISRSWTLEMWDQRLTPDQKRARDYPTFDNVRIVGPAGSGKTLTLCIRALTEVRKHSAQGRSLRVLFATHSWAMAERIDDTLRILNGGQLATEITVYPLLQVLRDVVGHSYASGLEILGEDSSEGRRLQFEFLSDSLASIPAVDRSVLAAQGLSPHIAEALSVDVAEKARSQVLEDLYEEINGVLLADGLIPGDRAKEEEYLTQHRSDQLPPFVTRGDRALVLLVYRDFLKRLRDWGVVTTDQLVSDSIKVLETFSWSVKRESEGYDLILIDELQLFDAQERFALNLLTRSPDSAGFTTAEDPSQGVFSAIASHPRREISTRGTRESIQLSGSHRFSPGILRFVEYLYQAFPLNAPLIQIGEEREAVPDVPAIYHGHSQADCFEAVAKLASNIVSSLGGDERLAIICLDGESGSMAQYLTDSTSLNVTLLRSLDDVERLSYSKRSVVVGEWRYLGGTQFSHVIVSSCTGSTAKSSFGQLKELTSLYVAASRAARVLRLIVGGRMYVQVDSAIENGLLRPENSVVQ